MRLLHSDALTVLPSWVHKTMKILVVEDDVGLAEMLAHSLELHHYQVELAADGVAGFELLEAFEYDLVLLDLHLPKLDGISFCRQLRAAGHDVPVLLMTAENTSASKISGLDAGADDYVVKPLDMGELLARTRALLRRGRVESAPILAWGQLTLDPTSCEVFCGRERFHIPHKEYEILELLLRNPHRIFSLAALLERLWEFEKIPSDNAVRTHVKSLRRKLKKKGIEGIIDTVYGLGYRLGQEPFVEAPSEVPFVDETFSEDMSRKSAGEFATAASLESSAAPVESPLEPVAASSALSSSFTASVSTMASSNSALSVTASSSSGGAQALLLDRLRSVWLRHEKKYLDLITEIEHVVPIVTVAHDGLALALDQNPQLVARSKKAAHTLKGALGSFGFMKASQIATQIEKLLLSALEVDRRELSHLPQLIQDLRTALKEFVRPAENGQQDKPLTPLFPLSQPPAPRLAPTGYPTIYQWLIVDADQGLMESLIHQTSVRGIQTRIVSTPDEARQALAQHVPDVVMLDPDCQNTDNQTEDGASTSDDGLALLRELNEQWPSLPVIVATARDTLSDRVKVLRSSGGCRFLQKPVSANQVIETLNHSLAKTRLAGSRILALDDDPAILQCLKELLSPWGFQLTLLSDPVQFWEALEQTSPDLLILDIEMPELNGLELCQVIRSDPRLGRLPILFLSAHSGPDIVRQVFEVGADDYISKPILGPELVARILNRLDRLRLLRQQAETDSLTGLSCRRQSITAFNRLLKLAARQETTLSLALLDLDNFKHINDAYGHEVGDQVLKVFGDYLRQTFRGEDVIARWGGEEFVVALFNSSREMAIQRLQEVLTAFYSHTFYGNDSHGQVIVGGADEAGRQPFQVSFSGGVAAYPLDGEDLQTLYRGADQALYAAKAAGRHQIFPSS